MTVGMKFGAEEVKERSRLAEPAPHSTHPNVRYPITYRIINGKSNGYQFALPFIRHMGAAVNICVTGAPFNLRTGLFITSRATFLRLLKAGKSALGNSSTAAAGVQIATTVVDKERKKT